MQTLESIIKERDERLAEVDEKRRSAQREGRYEDVARLNIERQQIFLDAHNKLIAHPDYQNSMLILTKLAKTNHTLASFRAEVFEASAMTAVVAQNATLFGKAAVLSATQPGRALPIPAPPKKPAARTPRKRKTSPKKPDSSSDPSNEP